MRQPLDKSVLIERFESVLKNEQGGRIQKWMLHPRRRIIAFFINRIYYPLTKQGTIVIANTCWLEKMKLLLPAAAEIYLTGTKVHISEIRLSQWLVKNVQSGQSFIDGGAHYGYFSLLFHYLAGDASSVLAFEPSAKTFEILELNKCKGIETINKALSDHTGFVKMKQGSLHRSEANAVTDKDDAEAVSLACIKLDEAITGSSLKIDYLKLDVEGHEFDALRGAENTITTHKPIVILEIWHPAYRNNSNQLQAIKWLCDKGYALYRLADLGEDLYCQSIDEVFLEPSDSYNVILKPQL